MNPLVSVVIIYYNQSKFVERSIESVLNQSYQNIECIVVDDGSTDETAKIVNQYVLKDQRVKYIYKENGGGASARNVGISISSGEWVQLLDGDDWLHLEKIENQLKSLENKHSANENVVIYSDYRIVFERDDGTETFETAKFRTMSKNDILKKIVGRNIGEWPPFTVNSILLSKNIFAEILFDEEVKFSDLNFYYRLLKLECSYIYVPIISMFYLQHPEGVSKNTKVAMIGYTDFLETILEIDKNDIKYFPNAHKMLRKCIMNNYTNIYNRIKKIILLSKLPVYIYLGNVILFNGKIIFTVLEKMGLFDKAVKLNIIIDRKYRSLFIAST